MGGGSFDYTSSSARSTVRKATGASAFTHDADAKAGKVDKLHESLDFTKKPMRESRDSVDNPCSTPIAVLCDITGSMGGIPKLVIDDLHKLMKMVIDGGVVTDPHVLFGAIGDATCDSVPVQMGEFEADDELVEKHLSNIYIERGGGGQNMESYELFMWLFANKVSTDAYEKRGEKGYLFIIGDEKFYPTVRKDLVKTYLNCDMDEDMTTKYVAEELQKKWEVFCIRPAGTNNYNSSDVQGAWTSILPEERVIKAETWESIVPYIAATISVMSGKSLDDTIASMKDSGFDGATIDGVTKSLVPLEKTSLPVVTGDAALAETDSELAVAHGERL